MFRFYKYFYVMWFDVMWSVRFTTERKAVTWRGKSCTNYVFQASSTSRLLLWWSDRHTLRYLFIYFRNCMNFSIKPFVWPLGERKKIAFLTLFLIFFRGTAFRLTVDGWSSFWQCLEGKIICSLKRNDRHSVEKDDIWAGFFLILFWKKYYKHALREKMCWDFR